MGRRQGCRRRRAALRARLCGLLRPPRYCQRADWSVFVLLVGPAESMAICPHLLDVASRRDVLR
eukprot:7461034-Lingulodinium_polyedra.AAC.1